jgi:hypothetical protein
LQKIVLMPPAKFDGFTRAKVTQGRACLVLKCFPREAK